MPRKILSALALFMVLASGTGLCSDVKDEKPDTLVQYRMEEIIVTATRIRSPLENLALSVSFIGPKEIDVSLKNSSTDLAGVLPGVFIMRTGDFGRSDISIRGLGLEGEKVARFSWRAGRRGWPSLTAR